MLHCVWLSIPDSNMTNNCGFAFECLLGKRFYISTIFNWSSMSSTEFDYDCFKVNSNVSDSSLSDLPSLSVDLLLGICRLFSMHIKDSVINSNFYNFNRI